MKNKSFLLLLLGLTISSCTQKCEDCDNSAYTLGQWYVEHLDHSGFNPRVDSLSISKAAYGIRLGAFVDEALPDPCGYLTPTIQTIQILTARPFDTIPAGTDITPRFRLYAAGQDNSAQSAPSYHSPYQAPARLNFLSAGEYAPYIDLLMIDAPTESDTFEFEIRVTFKTDNDSTLSVRTNPIYLF